MTDVTFQAMYLMVGAERVLREKEPGHQTHLELAELLAERAPLAARTRRNLARRQQLPSIFEYEVTEELGGWLAANPHSDVTAFNIVMRHQVALFMDQK